MIPFHSLSSAIPLLLFFTDARYRLISHAQTHTTMSRGKCLDQPKFCSGATIKASGETREPAAPPPPPHTLLLSRSVPPPGAKHAAAAAGRQQAARVAAVNPG